MTTVRGIRGAICAESNTREAILAATRELLVALIAANGIEPQDVAAAVFTTTQDLNAEFPALAARALGWQDVALLCAHEMNVAGDIPRCVRVLIHWNTDLPASEIIHLYLGEAARLRPDRAITADLAARIAAYEAQRGAH